MNVLAFELSSVRGSIALANEEGVIAAEEWPNDRRNSAPFFATLDTILRQHISPQMLVVGLGPGSYTGTRIAIAAALGLQVILRLAPRGLPSIAAISSESDYVVIGDAKRASFFFARIREHSLSEFPELLSKEKLAERLAGIPLPIYAVDHLPEFEKAKLRFPSATLLCAEALRSPQNLIPAPLAPIYLREPHITTPRHL